MNKADIEAALQAAFHECEAAGVPLLEAQRRILLQVAESLCQELGPALDDVERSPQNPLDELTPEQRQALLDYVNQFEQNDSWKAQLLDDWLHGIDSGPVQFVRDRFGPQWLERIQPFHLAVFAEQGQLRVKMGDRIEVSNSLWEWVPDTASSHREWFPCTVIRVFEGSDTERSYYNCTVRLDSGLEYDIYGMYDWNRSNWRWLEG
jgi:hypothetical protein